MEQLGLPIQTLKKLIMARNVDGTLNKTGTITSYVDLTMKIDGRSTDIQLLVTGLGNQRIIPLAKRMQPRHQLENWRVQMEKPSTPQGEKVS